MFGQGFDSPQLHENQYQKKSKARKSLICGLFYFTDLAKLLQFAQKKWVIHESSCRRKKDLLDNG